MVKALRQIVIIALGVALGLLVGGLAWRGLWLPVEDEFVTMRKV